MILPAFLTEWPSGEVVLSGHRIGLYHVITFHYAGYSPEMLHEQFPTLSPALIGQVLAFYDANRAEVDGYVAACQARIDRQRAAGKHVDIASLCRQGNERHPERVGPRDEADPACR